MPMVILVLHGMMLWKVQDPMDVLVDMMMMTLMLQSSAVLVKMEEILEMMTMATMKMRMLKQN